MTVIKPPSPAEILKRFAGGLEFGVFKGHWRRADKKYVPAWVEIEDGMRRIRLCGHPLGKLMEREEARAVLAWIRSIAEEE